MIDMVGTFIQSSAVHWVVLGGAVTAFIYKVTTSTNELLMGDMYADELDT